VWDAEVLVQETLVHSFGVLGRVFNPIANPRGYLTRVATNLWMDAIRRRGAGERAANWSERLQARAEADPGEVRDAASRLIETLSPQERAAFLLKEVFDMSLDEIAEMLVTSVGAVKTALHRGRKRLDQAKDLDTVSMNSVRRLSVSPALVDRFVERLNATNPRVAEVSSGRSSHHFFSLVNEDEEFLSREILRSGRHDDCVFSATVVKNESGLSVASGDSFEALISRLRELLGSPIKDEHDLRERVPAVHSAYRKSALNLIHYLIDPT
jgi:RNA polymerase sigma factor (sigma-70 family)